MLSDEQCQKILNPPAKTLALLNLNSHDSQIVRLLAKLAKIRYAYGKRSHSREMQIHKEVVLRFTHLSQFWDLVVGGNEVLGGGRE